MLHPTPTRIALLRDVARRYVYQHPCGSSHIAGGRQVTARIAEMAAAGWVRIDPDTYISDYEVRYWHLTDAGRAVLAAAEGGAA